jgi:hypothetical protein
LVGLDYTLPESKKTALHHQPMKGCLFSSPGDRRCTFLDDLSAQRLLWLSPAQAFEFKADPLFEFADK